MRKIRAFLLRCLHSRKLADDFEDELQNHVEMDIEDRIRAGLDRQEARRQALIRLGGIDQARQSYRERAGLPRIEALLYDVRYALRGFRRNPVFAFTAIVTLALAIGTSAAVFSVVDRILFRPLPYAHDDQLVSVGLAQTLEKQEFTLGGFYYEWRDNQRPFASITFERGNSECNLTEARPISLHCSEVAQNFLPTLGIAPVIGRNFSQEEDLPGGPKVALISDSLWLNRYNRDPGVLNRSISIDDHPARIIGVLPKNFEMPRLFSADIVFPARMDVAAQHTVNSGIGYPMWAFARLKPSVSVRQAEEQMQPLFNHTQQWIPAQIRNDFHLRVRSIRDRQMQEAYLAAWVLLGAVFAVLMIACANVASLFSARGAARQRELAVRSALGATRARLIMQTMTEALLLAIAGAAGGCALAVVLLRIFVAIAPTGVPLMAEARLDLRILLFAVSIALACAVLFGIMPSLEKPNASALAARSIGQASHAWFRRLLVTAQIAISVVLLTAASLLLKSFRNIETQALGMQTNHVLKVNVALNRERYAPVRYIMDFYMRAEASLRSVEGVTSVAMSDSLPPDSESWHYDVRFSDIYITGKPHVESAISEAVVVRSVTPNFFRVLQIPIVEGRGFTEDERDSKDSFVILSKRLASRLFPGTNPIGQHLQIGIFNPYFQLKGPQYTVVGVAANVKNAGLTGESTPEYYTLRRNSPEAWNRHCVLLVETPLPTSVIGPWALSRIAQIDPLAPVEIEPLTQSVSRLADRPRFETALISFFAITGLIMALIGLYGVVAYTAVQRTQEIGIRMALGSGRLDVLRLILGEGMRLALFGGAAGLVAALALSRLIKSLLFSVGPTDPGTFVAVAFLLVAVGALASFLPARRAAMINPVEALRSE